MTAEQDTDVTTSGRSRHDSQGRTAQDRQPPSWRVVCTDTEDHVNTVETEMFRRPAILLALAMLGLLGLSPSVSNAQVGSFGGVAAPRGDGSRIRIEVAQRGAIQRPRPPRQWRLPERPGPSQEPASARGYADGYRRGLDDGRDRDRYDPVGSGSYRSGNAGYYREYGPREAYRNNYRAGFRQGYEDGYRDGARGRR